MDYYKHQHAFLLENNQSLPSLTIAYKTFGRLNAQKSNVVWICHHLTANADVQEWWPGLVGIGKALDPDKYFIVCANIIGSCYGTTGPLSINTETGSAYYHQFPSITVRDIVAAHILLRKHLQITNIFLLVGGSMGGHQALEWSIIEKNIIKNLFLLATSAAETAWGIAAHTAQRLAIEADDTWLLPTADAGKKGLKAARAIGMLTYRNYAIMKQNQTEEDSNKVDDFKASSYINYQGDKLVKRFNAYSYWLLTKVMDTHNIARGRGGDVKAVLQTVTQKTLIIGINSDILCPIQEQQQLATFMPHATFAAIDSNYGHDGFIVESTIIEQHLLQWLNHL
jgi:homoserine O-acetyltransferase/O-succinyltransferase